jgi:hypothetical protein
MIKTGNVVPQPVWQRGLPHKLASEDVEYIKTLILFRPEYFLDELANLLSESHLISAHFSTINHELEQTGLSKKILRILLKNTVNHFKLTTSNMFGSMGCNITFSWMRPRRMSGTDRGKGGGLGRAGMP